MKARILAAILLMFTFATAYNQTSRRGERDNDKNNQQTERKEQNKEAVKTERAGQTRTERASQPRTERSTQPRTENSGRRGNTNTQSTQKSESVNPADNSNREKQQQPTQTTRRGENNKEFGEPRGNNKEQKRSESNNREVAREQNRETERRVVVHEYNREPQRKVIVRDNRREERTYVRIDRPVRKVVVVNHPKHYHPVSVEYRRVHNPYRAPVHSHIYWNISLHNDFRVFYPEVRMWRYDIGYRLPSIPAYDADYYIGDVARVYGKVYDIHYEYETDEYFLYFGDYFPYQDFSVVVPGRDARAFSRRPERFFKRSHLAVTGYITDYDGKPEIVIRRASQIELY